ncbi:hypothetical protein Tco_1530432 [Tanacetum coccineum]
MDNPNITMEEYIRLEEEKARRRGKVYNWETATYGELSSEPTVSSLNNDKPTLEYRLTNPTMKITRYQYNVSWGMDTAYRLHVQVLGPREGKSTNVGGVFTNLEILKCWSLENSRQLFNTNKYTWRITTEQISGEFLILILFNFMFLMFYLYNKDVV